MRFTTTLRTLAAFSFVPLAGFSQLTLLNQFGANQGSGVSAGEIVAFDPGTARLFVTSSGSTIHQVNIFNISSTGAQSDAGVIDFSAVFGTTADTRGLSSVAVDPLGRFGVAALIPTANSTTVGKVGFFNLATGAVIGTADVGYHPDSITFSSDGSRLVIVNEGEFNPNVGTGYVGTNATLANAPGSISVFNIAGINAGNLNTLPTLTAVTKDFSAGNLATGVSIDTLRNSNLAAVGTGGTFINSVPVFNTAAPEAIEPEYASISGDKVYVSLQDNNALAVFDLVTEKWTEVKSLGAITQTIDASDTGSTININQSVPGMPMPDTVGTYVQNGKTYVVTANEGDARVDDRDISRLGDISGSDSMNPLLDASFPTTQTGIRGDAALGRLNVSRIDGDTNGDGKIDVPTMLGTRSYSIYEQGESGLVRVYDSGNFFETWIAANGGWQDGRSDDKGPEPEGLTVVTIAGRTYLFIGMERTSHVFMFDVTDPTAPAFIDAELVSGALRPEGFNFVTAENSPTGTGLLFVGFEGDGTSATEQIAVFSVGTSAVPEPASYAAIFGAAVLGLACCRRRRSCA